MKKLITLAVVSAMLLAVTSCGNMNLLDTNYTFTKAIIAMPDGTSLTVEIDQWKDFVESEQIQIIAKDGTVYLVSTFNAVLINEEEK